MGPVLMLLLKSPLDVAILVLVCYFKLEAICEVLITFGGQTTL